MDTKNCYIVIAFLWFGLYLIMLFENRRLRNRDYQNIKTVLEQHQRIMELLIEIQDLRERLDD